MQIKNVLKDISDENTKKVLSNKIDDSIKNLMTKKVEEMDELYKKIDWNKPIEEKNLQYGTPKEIRNQ